MAKAEAEVLQILSKRPERSSKVQAAVRLVICQLSIIYGLHILHTRPASWGLYYRLYTLIDILVGFSARTVCQIWFNKVFGNLSVPDMT